MAVLGSVSRLSQGRGFTESTNVDDINRDLTQRYKKKVSNRWIYAQLNKLEEKGLVRREKIKRKVGRFWNPETIYTTTRGESVVLTLIKLDKDTAFVHNGYGGVVHDPPGTTTERNPLPFGPTRTRTYEYIFKGGQERTDENEKGEHVKNRSDNLPFGPTRREFERTFAKEEPQPDVPGNPSIGFLNDFAGTIPNPTSNVGAPREGLPWYSQKTHRRNFASEFLDRISS